jgi:hypothetical protein
MEEEEGRVHTDLKENDALLDGPKMCGSPMSRGGEDAILAADWGQ